MKIINNRYKIIKLIKKDGMIESFIAFDLKEHKGDIKLNIINSKNLSKKIIKDLYYDFLEYSNIKSKSMVNIYDFGIIRSIDNKLVDYAKYFYVTDFIDDMYIATKNTQNISNENDILNIFYKLSRCINTLHLKGYMYENINLDNIYILFRNNGYKIVLQDMITSKINKFMGYNEIIQYPKINYTRANKSIRNDIYSLGKVLNSLILKEINIYDLKKEPIYKTNLSNNFLRKIKDIIYKCTIAEVNSYSDIYTLIKDLNYKFNKNYSYFNYDEINKLNFNYKNIGRKKEINYVMNKYNNMNKCNNKSEIILVHGEEGIGKSKFLKEIRDNITLQGGKVCFTTCKNLNSIDNIKELIKDLIAYVPSKILEKYENELANLLPNFIEDQENISLETLDENKKRLKLLNRLASFVNDYMNYENLIFIIDDIQDVDDFFIDFLETVLSKKNHIKNIMIIISFCQGKNKVNKEILNFINKIYNNIKLKELNEEQTGVLIKNILKMPYKPKDLSKTIYMKTYGNPLLIEEIVKFLYYRGFIYINKDTGIWYTDYEYKDFYIPKDINQAILEQIKELDVENFNLLKYISIFKGPVSKTILKDINEYEKEKLDKNINILLDKEHIWFKKVNKEVVYGFYNKVLKNFIYENMELKEKIDKHKKIALYLEKKYKKNNDAISINEIIYHFEKAKMDNKVIDYCLINALRMEKLKNNIEVVNNIEKAMEFINKINISKEEEIKVYIKIGKLYDKIGDVDLALIYFNRALDTCEKVNEDKFKYEIVINIAKIYFNKNFNEETKKYLNITKEYINKNKDLDKYLHYQIMNSEVLIKEGKLDEAKKIYDECIKLGDDNIKAKFYHVYGNICFSKMDAEKSLYYFRKSISLTEKNNDYEGLVKGLNNIAVIYEDVYQDGEKAIQYFLKILDICRNIKSIKDEVYTLYNLGECYYYLGEHEKSKKYFKETEKKAKKCGLDYIILHSYIFLCKNYLKIEEYNEAYKYYKLGNNEVRNFFNNDKNIAEYYKVLAQFNLEFGNFKEAYKFIIKSKEIYKNNKTILAYESRALFHYINIIKNINNMSSKDINNELDDIKIQCNKLKAYKLKINLFFNISNFLYKNNFIKEGKEIFNYIKEELNYNCSRDIEIKVEYLEIIYSDNRDNVKIYKLKDILKYANEINNKKLQYEIYNEIGKYYYKKNNFYSLICYLACYEIIKDLINRIPKGYVNLYLENFKLKDSICKLIILKNCCEGKAKNIKECKAKCVDLQNIYNIDTSDIFKNKRFIKSVRSLYKVPNDVNIMNLESLVKNLDNNSPYNLNKILQYIIYLTIGSSGFIIYEGNKNLNVVASVGEYDKLTKSHLEIINKVRISKKAILCSLNKDKFCKGIENIKAFICMPIILNKNVKENKILGYLYVESKMILNNFNDISLNKCKDLNGLMCIILEKYRLNNIVSIDKLTGTLTRKALEDALYDKISFLNKDDNQFTIMMFDLDHFKRINDKFGHQEGDKVLKKVCNIILNNLGENDICGRYGGEEFIVLLDNANIEKGKEKAEDIRKKIEESFIFSKEMRVTVSIGLSSYPTQARWKQELIEKADRALYVAKENGRNQCVVWRDDFKNKINGTNKLTGIITENDVENNRNVLSIIELLDIVNSNYDFEEKIYNILGRIIEITEAAYGTILIIKDNKISNKYIRKKFSENWEKEMFINEEIINKVISSRKGLYMIDWNSIIHNDNIEGEPDWYSIMSIPFIKNDEIKGVLYLSVFIKDKEFNFKDYNFISNLCKIINVMF